MKLTGWKINARIIYVTGKLIVDKREGKGVGTLNF